MYTCMLNFFHVQMIHVCICIYILYNYMLSLKILTYAHTRASLLYTYTIDVDYSLIRTSSCQSLISTLFILLYQILASSFH